MREKLIELQAKKLPELGVGGYGTKGGAKPQSSRDRVFRSGRFPSEYLSRLGSPRSKKL